MFGRKHKSQMLAGKGEPSFPPAGADTSQVDAAPAGAVLAPTAGGTPDGAASSLFGERYQVLGRIGRGGMAEVFLAHDATLDRQVAIKAVLPQLAGMPGYDERFRNEARAAAKLTSPYVVNIYDWGQAEGSGFIVMEYVRGIDLKRAIARRGPIHPRKVAEIAVQACAALEEAHALGIIHRDIKSSNIMMQASGDIKIMDFGIAKAGLEDVAAAGEAISGTASYMSPEQKRGMPVDARSDLYSLGVALYEMCTGVLPYTPAVARLDGAPGSLIPASHLSAHVDARMAALLARALEVDPAARYADAAQMRAAFAAYLDGPEQPPINMPYPAFWVLACVRGPESLVGTMMPFDGPCVLGRGEGADIRLDDATVSSKHVRLTPRGMYLLVEDLYSINGTRVNGAPLQGRALCLQGTTLDLGAVRLKVGVRGS